MNIRTKALPLADPATISRILADHGDAGWLEITRCYGRVFRYRRGVVTCVPEDLQAVLRERAHTLRRPMTHRFADRFLPGAAGILFKDGAAWRKRLKPLMATFNRQAVAGVETALRGVVERHVAKWPTTREGVDLFADVTALGIEIALAVGFNLDLSDSTVRELGDVLVEYKLSTMSHDPRSRLDVFGFQARRVLDLPRVAAGFLGIAALVRRLDRLVQEILRKRPWADPGRQGWVETLSRAGLRGRALTTELNHVYGAFTAADYTATCALAELARAPAWAEQVRRAPSEGEDAARPVLLETYRRYPVAMVIFRELGQHATLGGARIRARTTVMMLPYALHHDPDWWDDPFTFDPGRWQRPVSPRALLAYEPFLKGPRRCIGQDFAEQQVRVVLETVLGRYDLEVSDRPRVNTFIVPRLAAPLAYRASRRPGRHDAPRES